MNELILLVEDEDAILMAMQLYLQRSGYRVIKAQTGPDGLKAAMSERPDLIMLDLLLPEMNGFLVLEALKENPSTADIPVVICSAKTQESDQKRARELGADGFLSKPFTPGQLLAKVKQYLPQ